MLPQPLPDGSVARALALLDEDALALRQQALDLLEALPTLDAGALHALGDALAGTDPQPLAALVDTINVWLAQRLDREGSAEAGSAAWRDSPRPGRASTRQRVTPKPTIWSENHSFSACSACLPRPRAVDTYGRCPGQPYYVTTAIAYPNGPPHIGHAYEVIATDAIARFQRLDGHDVYFLTGTDEHGIKMHQTAAREKLTPRELVARNVPIFQAMVKKLNCSNDDYIRTTEPRHYRSSEAIWSAMQKAGDIYLDKYAGWYSVRDEAYYDESETRLDEKGRRLGPQGTPVEWVEEESYFFRLSKYADKLLELYEKHPDFVLPKERMNEVASFVRGGLKDLSISRTTFDWGVPVPGAPKHVMYVWVDALTNYITGVGYPDTNSRNSRNTGRPTCTSSARISCASMPCIGRPF